MEDFYVQTSPIPTQDCSPRDAPNNADSTDSYTKAMMYIAGYGPSTSGGVGGYGTLAIGYNQSGTAGAALSQTTGLVIDSSGQVGLFQTNSGGLGIGANEGIGLLLAYRTPRISRTTNHSRRILAFRVDISSEGPLTVPSPHRAGGQMVHRALRSTVTPSGNVRNLADFQ